MKNDGKLKDCRDCKYYMPFDEDEGHCSLYHAHVSDPKENYCNG